MKTRLLVPLLAMLLLDGAVRLACGQSTPSISTALEDREIYEGQSVLYRIDIRGVEDPPEPELPKVDGLLVQPLPPQSFNSRQVTIINGQRRDVVHVGRQYNYRITPARAGRFTIPAPTVSVAGKALQGKAETLVVRPPDEQDLARLEIRVDRPRLYPTQTVTVTLAVSIKELPPPYGERDPLALRTAPPALQIPWVFDNELPEGLVPTVPAQQWLGQLRAIDGVGFQVNQIEADFGFSLLGGSRLVFRPETKRIQQPGKDAAAAGVRRYEFTRSFFCKRVGQYTFGPASLTGTLATRSESGSGLTGKAVFATARPVQVTVRDVPTEGRPASYTGLIGRFEARSELAPAAVKVGDPLTLTLSITGRGSLGGAVPPDLAKIPGLAERFKIYEATQQTQANTVRFSYGLRPLVAGEEPFPPLELACFDPDAEKFVTLATDPQPLKVAPADRLSPEQVVLSPGTRIRSRQLQAAGEGIFANIAEEEALRQEAVDPRPYAVGLAAAGLGYAALALVVAGLRRRWADPAAVRRRGAASAARRKLHAALRRLDRGETLPGLEGLRLCLAELAADLNNTPAAGLTPKEVARLLGAQGTPEPLAAEVQSLLEACDAARYGGAAGDSAALAATARTLLDAVLRSSKSLKGSA